MNTKFVLALLGWFVLVTYASGQEKEYFQKAPLGIKTVAETITGEFPKPEFFVPPPIVYKKFYNRRGDLIEEQCWSVNEFRPTRSYEYDYDPQSDRLMEFRAFYGSGEHDFLIHFDYNGNGSGVRHLINQNQDGALWGYDQESWDFDDRGRIKKGIIYYRDSYVTVTYRYHELAFESRNKWGDGKIAEISSEHIDNDGKRYAWDLVTFSYDAQNNLEEVRYADKDHIHRIESRNSRGDVVEERFYNRDREFTGRYHYTNKYEKVRGFELKTEVLKECFYDYEHTDGTKEAPYSVTKCVYEYEFWEEDWNLPLEPKPEGKKEGK